MGDGAVPDSLEARAFVLSLYLIDVAVGFGVWTREVAHMEPGGSVGACWQLLCTNRYERSN